MDAQANHRRYLHSRRSFPVCVKRPLSYEDFIFDELCWSQFPPDPKCQRDRSWISFSTWSLIDRRAALKQYLTHHYPRFCSASSLPPLDAIDLSVLIDRFASLRLTQDSSDISLDSLIEDFYDLTLDSTNTTINDNTSGKSTSFLSDSSQDKISSGINIAELSSAFKCLSFEDLCPHQREFRRLGTAIRRGLRNGRRR